MNILNTSYFVGIVKDGMGRRGVDFGEILKILEEGILRNGRKEVNGSSGEKEGGRRGTRGSSVSIIGFRRIFCPVAFGELLEQLKFLIFSSRGETSRRNKLFKLRLIIFIIS